jgi:hypothetical protein
MIGPATKSRSMKLSGLFDTARSPFPRRKQFKSGERNNQSSVAFLAQPENLAWKMVAAVCRGLCRLLKSKSAFLNRRSPGAKEAGLVRASADVRRAARIHVAQRRMWL